jgi:hypothetical protein
MKRRDFEVGDYIKTNFDESRGISDTWKGKIRRLSECSALIEWSFCGSLPTDICTNVMFEELVLTKKGKRG